MNSKIKTINPTGNIKGNEDCIPCKKLVDEYFDKIKKIHNEIVIDKRMTDIQKSNMIFSIIYNNMINLALNDYDIYLHMVNDIFEELKPKNDKELTN